MKRAKRRALVLYPDADLRAALEKAATALDFPVARVSDLLMRRGLTAVRADMATMLTRARS